MKYHDPKSKACPTCGAVAYTPCFGLPAGTFHHLRVRRAVYELEGTPRRFGEERPAK